MGKAAEVSRAGGAARSASEPPSDAGNGWTGWQAVPGFPPLSGDVLAEILNGGQAFRWNRQPDHSWLGFWSDHVVRLRLGRDERVEWSAPVARAAATGDALAHYLGCDRDFAALTDLLPWRSDPHLAQCIIPFSGLRILRQPFGETLLGFLCSATKQIIQIKQMLALLAERHGRPLADGGVTRIRIPATEETGTRSQLLHRLPTWPELANAGESELRSCLLGFRARYISETARFLVRHDGWLEETESLPYSAARERLCSLPGVGGKIADCVLLFGAGRLEAFPVDVWILKTLARRYGLDGWRTPQLAQFGRVHFGPLAGLAQQYLFAWERAQKKSEV